MKRLLLCAFAALATGSLAVAGEVAHLTFDGTLDDASGNANHGVFTGDAAPTYTAGFDGTIDGAIAFDGVNDIVNLPQGAGLPVTNEPAFSIAMWVNGAVQQDRRVFSEGSSTSNTPLFNLGTHNTAANGTLNSFLRPGPSHRQTTGIAFDGTWHHIAWVDNGGLVDVYIDGVRDPRNLEYAREVRAVDRTSIGAIQRGAAAAFFAGAIDEVRIYDHALTRDEVEALIPTPGCPVDGDTHLTDLVVDHDGAGSVSATAVGNDDGADALIYTFTIIAENGSKTQFGPQSENTIATVLGVGTWTLVAEVDDDLGCFDRAADAIQSAEIVVDPPPQLVARYAFDGDLLDSSGNDNHGTFIGGEAPLFTEGHDGTVDGAIVFDGVDDLVRATHNFGLPLYNSPAYSVAMWVKGDGLNDNVDDRIFNESNVSGDNNPLINLGTSNDGASGKLDVFLRHGPTFANHLKTGRDAFDNDWHHIAWVDDNGEGRVYIDGVLEDLRISYAKPSPVNVNATILGGILRGTACCFFTGAMDEVQLYNYALSPEEVLALVPEPVDCPDAGDTHCMDLAIAGPDTGTEGDYTATATALDDSADESLWYTFYFESPDGVETQVGPQPGNTATRTLTPGMWSVRVVIDDSILCRDVTEDAGCSTQVEVLSEPRMRIAAWSFDGHLLDEEPGMNDGTFTGGEAPNYVTGYDCAKPGAIQFDGVDDFVRVPTGSPSLTQRAAFTLAMWVKGDGLNDNVDDRIFSEGSTTSNTPLWNLGTDNQGTSAKLDLFLRPDSGSIIANHVLSTQDVFDNTWHHIAWTDNNGVVVLYVDGAPDDTNFSYAREPFTVDTTTIGGILRGASCCWFTGAIDQVEFFNYALDGDEVLDVMGSAPVDCCPAEGDTRCMGLDVVVSSASLDPDGVSIRTYRATATAMDDSGDPILYTFTADNGIDPPMVAGPQSEDSAEFVLTPGSWTVSVLVDDDPECSDTSKDATCSTPVDVPCDGPGDTHCFGLTVTGPEDGGPGDYVASANGSDDTGDPISYTFTADNGIDPPMVIGPQAESDATFSLTEGSWTIRVSVDDDPECDDLADDATCQRTVEVLLLGGLRLPGDCNGDGELDISDGACIFRTLFLGDPVFFPCGSGLPDDPANIELLDWQGDGEAVAISDGVGVLEYLFRGAPPHILGLDCLRILDCPDSAACAE